MYILWQLSDVKDMAWEGYSAHQMNWDFEFWTILKHQLSKSLNALTIKCIKIYELKVNSQSMEKCDTTAWDYHFLECGEFSITWEDL